MTRKPDYEREGVTLYCGDCLEVLPEVEAGSVDAVVTDPVWPGASVPLAGADNPVTLWRNAWNLFRDAKRVAVQMGCDTNPSAMIAGMGIRWNFFRVCWLEYVRPHYKGRLLYTSDVAYLFGDAPTSRPGHRVIPGRYMPTEINGEKTEHPCPRKPQHVTWLVHWWSEPSSCVLDPFMGSGTTGVACVRTGRRFIGIEIDPNYFDIAVRRIEAEFDRHPLFEQPKPKEVKTLF